MYFCTITVHLFLKKYPCIRNLITQDIISAGELGLSERIERIKVDERSSRR